MKCSAIGIGFNGAETNCRIAYILGILLMNSCNTDIFLATTIIGFNGAETNCRIAHILGILLMNSCNTDIFFSNYYHWQSIRFELLFM